MGLPAFTRRTGAPSGRLGRSALLCSGAPAAQSSCAQADGFFSCLVFQSAEAAFII